jgi:Icc-related predicted phosphoesterase
MSARACAPRRNAAGDSPPAAAGEPRIISVGSRAVRELVERHQPLLALHGHIHESKGITRIGKTTCVNPGSAYGEGVLDGAVVDIRDGKIRSCQLVSG